MSCLRQRGSIRPRSTLNDDIPGFDIPHHILNLSIHPPLSHLPPPHMIVLSATTITVVLYVCVTTCFITILLRLIISWKLTRAWTPEDGWMLGTLCFLVGLWFSGHGIKYDTNNVAHPELLTAHEIERRVIGSKTVLVGRFCYASSYVLGCGDMSTGMC